MGPAGTPRREEHGDLLVLHLAGTYREMGRQHVELLGPLAREVYQAQREDWDRFSSALGRRGRIGGRIVPAFWMQVWRRLAPGATFDSILGMADVLGEPPTQVCKAALGSLVGAASTSLAATRSTTAHGHALVGRNSDLSDRYGLRRPLVSLSHPSNGDLACVSAGWPLLPSPAAGVNEAGLVLANNTFGVARPLPLLPAPAEVLRRARTVAEAVSMFRRQRAAAVFATLADAEGEIAVVEYAPSACAVYRPEGDWLAQANHARTPHMVAHDRARYPDSFRRQEALEQATRDRLGRRASCAP